MEMKGLKRRERPMVALLVFILATLVEKNCLTDIYSLKYF